MKTKNHYDAIVVGGGPAGSATATHLARVGKSVLLLERSALGRDKPCGECFSPPVRGLLHELGVLEKVVQSGAGALSGATVHMTEGGTFTGLYSAYAKTNRWAAEGGLVVERRILDKLLWENAASCGAEARTHVAVRGVLRDEASANSTTAGRIVGVRTDAGNFTATVLIGADGSRSRIAEAMRVVRPIRRLQKIGLVAHFQMPQEAHVEGAKPIEMYVSPTQAACGFAVGASGVATLAFEIPLSENRALAALGKVAYLEQCLRSLPLLQARLSGAALLRVATVGNFGHTVTTPVADGALLVGDAAAFIDPFTGEGVYFALRGAKLAAQALLSALHHGDTSARGLEPYARAWRHEFRPKYAVCDLVQWAIHQRALFGWLTARLRHRAELTNRIIGVTGDMASPFTLLSPRLLLSLAFMR